MLSEQVWLLFNVDIFQQEWKILIIVILETESIMYKVKQKNVISQVETELSTMKNK